MDEVLESENAEESTEDLSISQVLEKHIESVDAKHAENDGEDGDVQDESLEDNSQEASDGDAEYTPDFSYNVKGEAKEFDERLKSLIKTKDDEDYVRDIVTRAEGLDDYKTKDEEWGSKYSTLENHSTQLVSGYKKLQTLRDGGDMAGLQTSLGITDEMIYNRATQLLDEDDLPEEQKTLLTENRKMQDQINELNGKVTGFETATQDDQLVSDVNELKGLMAADENLAVIEAMKNAGTDIADEVVMRGSWIFQQTGKEPGVEEVFNMILNQNKGLVHEGIIPSDKKETDQSKVIVQKATIPGVRGVNTSSVDEPLTSLDQLYAISNQIKVGRR